MPARCKAKIQKKLTIDQNIGTIEHIHMIETYVLYIVHHYQLHIASPPPPSPPVTTTIYCDFEHCMISYENPHHQQQQHYVIKWIQGLLLKE